jgi:hypothetical protein
VPSPGSHTLRHSSDSEDPFRRSIPALAAHFLGRGAMLSPTPEPVDAEEAEPFAEPPARASDRRSRP